MPMNSTESPVNRLTGSHTDPATHTPAYKDAVVAMRVLPEIGESPLPRVNHRFGHPTPQRGVEVERKWQRPDYRLPEGRPWPSRFASNPRRTIDTPNSRPDFAPRPPSTPK